MNRLYSEFVFHVRLLLRNGYFVQTALVAPAVFVILRGQVGMRAEHLWADGAVVGIWTATATAVGILGYQRSQGTLEQIALTPRRLGTALAPIALACTALGVVSLPVALVTPLLFGGRPAMSNPWAGVAGLILVFVACGSTALVLSGLFVITRHALVYEPIIIAPVLLLSGAVIERQALPMLLQRLGELHPLTGAVTFLQAGVSGGVPSTTLAMSAFQVTLTSLLLVGIATWVLRIAERKALRSGTLALS